MIDWRRSRLSERIVGSLQRTFHAYLIFIIFVQYYPTHGKGGWKTQKMPPKSALVEFVFVNSLSRTMCLSRGNYHPSVLFGALEVQKKWSHARSCSLQMTVAHQAPHRVLLQMAWMVFSSHFVHKIHLLHITQYSSYVRYHL